MPAPRKPKKVFIQFAVALVVAGVLGLGALIFGISIITNLSGNTRKAQQEVEKIRAEAKAEVDRVKAQLKQQEEQQQQTAKVTYKTVQAAVDIQPGQPITKDMLVLMDEEQTPPAGTLTMLSQAVGKMVKSQILQGETLQQTKLLDAAVLTNIKPGMRAMTIQVNNIGTVNNSLTAGSHVDVLTTVTREDKSITKTMLQNVEVIASSNDPARLSNDKDSLPVDNSGDSAVTIAVTPKQAELLTLANQLGKFHLTLRRYNDTSPAKVAGADLNALLLGSGNSVKKKAVPGKPSAAGSDGFHNVNYSGNLPSHKQKPIPHKFSMQVYRGAGSETVEFQQ